MGKKVEQFFLLMHSMARANLKKVKTSQLLLPQHQSTYSRGPESASIEIPPFRPHFKKISKAFLLSKSCFTMFTFRGTSTK